MLLRVSEERLDKVLADVEVLIKDMEELFEQDKIVKQRLNEIKANPSIGKSEKDLNNYFKQKGIKVE